MNKYRAKKTVVDGITFERMKEANRSVILKKMEKSGIINNLEVQPQFDCIVNQVKVCTYKADFRYFMQHGKGPQNQEGYCVVEDVKGFKTPVYKLKKKLVEACHIGVKIEEV